MSNIEEKTPYYSKDFEISTVTSPSKYAGFLKRSITIRYGNQKERTIENPNDWGDVGSRSMIDELDEQWKDLTKWAREKNTIFIDEIRNRDSHQSEIVDGVKELPKKEKNNN